MDTLQEQKQSSGPVKQTFTPQTSTKAIAVVVAAIIAGFLMVMIVNSNNSNETASTVETTVAPTTTVAAQDQATETSAPVTTTQSIGNAKDPSEVNVLVLNGSNAAGIAGGVTEALAELDYQTLTAANDTAKGSGTTVYYKNGFEDDAEQLATNVLPGVLNNLNIGQDVTVERFPLSAPTTWDQQDLVAANIVIVVGNA